MAPNINQYFQVQTSAASLYKFWDQSVELTFLSTLRLSVNMQSMLISRINVYLDRPSGNSWNTWSIREYLRYEFRSKIGCWCKTWNCFDRLVGECLVMNGQIGKELFQDFENGANVVFSSTMRSNWHLSCNFVLDFFGGNICCCLRFFFFWTGKKSYYPICVLITCLDALPTMRMKFASDESPVVWSANRWNLKVCPSFSSFSSFSLFLD